MGFQVLGRWVHPGWVAVVLTLILQAPAAWAIRAPDHPDARGARSRAEARPTLAPATVLGAQAPGALLRDQRDLGMLPRALPGGPKNEQAIISALQRYLAQHPAWLGGVSLKALRVHHAAITPATDLLPGMAYVQFVQQYQGLDVDGSYASFSVKLLPGRAVLMAASAQLYPRLAMPAARRSAEAPRIRAARALGLQADKARVRHERRHLRHVGGRWRRVQEARFEQSELKAVVDEDSGESWVEDDRLYETIQGRVRGRGILFDPVATGSNLTTLDLSDLRVTSTGGTMGFTDATGSFDYAGETGSAALSGALSGRWAGVQTTSPDVNLNFNVLAEPGVPADIVFNPESAEQLATAQVNGYYHTDFIHDWVNARLLNPLPGIDVPLPVNVNLNQTCNAYYNYSSINFFKAGSGCVNTAYDTVVYHEYGHFVDHKAGGITNGGLSEGWGDVLAAFATNQPVIGEGFFSTASSKIRTADNAYQFPASGTDEVHALGQAWAGFAWHLRQRLITKAGQAAGVQLAEQLIIPVLTAANATDIPKAVLEVLIRDDEDGNLQTPSPNQADILASAAQHSIPIPEDDTTPPAPVNNLAAAAGGLGKVVLTWTATGDDGLVGTAKSYDIRYATTPILTNTDFTAAIQATGEPLPQASGSPEQMTVAGLTAQTTYYFAMVVRDNMSNASALSNGASATTSAGSTVFAETFESGAAGWALTGLWHPSTVRSSSPVTSMVYNDGVDYDTGAANSGTLTSPAIDLTAATQALLTFRSIHRTEALDTYDLRTVEVSSNGGLSWTVLQTLKNTIAYGVWSTQGMDLTSQAGKIIQLRFRFDTRDASFNAFEGWYVDDVTVVSDQPPTTAPLKIVAPNGGETWAQGSAQSIRWSGGDPTWELNLVLLNSSKAVVGFIAEGTSNDGWDGWTVPPVPVTGQYFVRVICATCSGDTPGRLDDSDLPFTITSLSPLKIVAPNGGETWAPGSTQTIRWTGGAPGWALHLVLLNSSKAVVSHIADGTSNDGLETWALPSALAPGQYFIGAVCVSCPPETPGGWDESDQPFTVAKTRYLSVIAPNGGETLVAGQTYRIRWKSYKVDKVYIGYSFGPGSLNWIATNIPTNPAEVESYYDWTVSLGGSVLPRQIKIDITGYETGVGSHTDQSDGFLTVQGVLPRPLQGRLYNSVGNPYLLPGVHIAVYKGMELVTTTTTTPLGTYSTSPVPADGSTYRIVPTMEAYSFTPLERSVTLLPGQIPPQQNFQVTQIAYKLTGSVVEVGPSLPFPKPMVGAPVTLRKDGQVLATLATGSDGKFTTSYLPAGATYELLAPASNAEPFPHHSFSPPGQLITLQPGQPQPAPVTFNGIQVEYQIHGLLLRSDGAPFAIEGVPVDIWRDGTVWDTAQTDPNGEFTSQYLATGATYEVRPVYLHHTFTPERYDITLTSGSIPLGPVFTVRQTEYRIEGSIVHPDGSPLAVAGVAVRLSIDTRPVATVLTNAQGEFSSMYLPTGSTYRVQPVYAHYGFTPDHVDLPLIADAPPTEVIFTAKQIEYPIRGYVRVLGTNAALAGAAVTVRHQGVVVATPLSDVSGRYATGYLPADGLVYSLTPQLAGYAFVPSTQNIVFQPGQAPAPVDFMAAPLGNLLANGSFEQGKVNWNGWGSRVLLSTEARTDGRYAAKVLLDGLSRTLWHDRIPASAGKQYAASAMIRTVGVNTGRVSVEVTFERAGTVLRKYVFGYARGTFDWQRYASTTMIAPSGTEHMRIRLRSEPGTGSAYVDDVRAWQMSP